MKFEWDPLKNKANILKHKVSFEEAETVFDDKNAKYIYDEAHSYIFAFQYLATFGYNAQKLALLSSPPCQGFQRPKSIRQRRQISYNRSRLRFKEQNVCHCYRGADEDIIRIISARKATKTEIDYYYGRIEI